MALAVKNLPANAGDTSDAGSIPGLGRSPGGGNGMPVFLPGESHGQRSLAGYSPWGHKESDTTEQLHFLYYTVKGFSIVNKAEVDIFLELPCFFDDPTDVGNFISDSSAFSKTSLNIWKLMYY